MATLPSNPYITEMIPIGPNSEGVMTFRMTGMFAEVFDNLQVTLLFIHIGSQKYPVVSLKTIL